MDVSPCDLDAPSDLPYPGRALRLAAGSHAGVEDISMGSSIQLKHVLGALPRSPVGRTAKKAGSHAGEQGTAPLVLGLSTSGTRL